MLKFIYKILSYHLYGFLDLRYNNCSSLIVFLLLKSFSVKLIFFKKCLLTLTLPFLNPTVVYKNPLIHLKFF